MAVTRKDPGNVLTGAETIASGTWECTSLYTSTHAMYCADVASTPWGSCDGTCLYNDQAGLPQVYLPCFTTSVDLTTIYQNNGAFWLSFDVMIVWLPNSTLPNDPPASQIQLNALVGIINQSLWVPLLRRQASSGSFTTFSWRSILSQSGTIGMLKINLDHAPAGNGSYGVYVDKVSLSTSSLNTPISSGLLGSTTLTSTLSSGHTAISGSLGLSSTGIQNQTISVVASGSLEATGIANASTASGNDSSQSGSGMGVTTASTPLSPSNPALLIGIIVGLVALLILAICAFLWIRRLQKKKQPVPVSSLLPPPMLAPPYTRLTPSVSGDHRVLRYGDIKAGLPSMTPTVDNRSPTDALDRPPAYDPGDTPVHGSRPDFRP